MIKTFNKYAKVTFIRLQYNLQTFCRRRSLLEHWGSLVSIILKCAVLCIDQRIMCIREDIVLGRYEPEWRMRGYRGETEFSESMLSAVERQNQGDFGWLFSVAGITKAKKVFTTSLKQCRREVHIKYADQCTKQYTLTS